MRLTEGSLIADRFRLVRPLGRGGMGEVWVAHDQRLESPCAVKFLHPSLEMDGAIKRFALEAKAAAQLRSPNVVQILDHGATDGVPYIAMELLEGEDLASRLRRGGRLTRAHTAEVVAQIARALGRAHAAGLVHRDLKPANVFLVRDEERELVKVLDFGIAKLLDRSPASKGPPSVASMPTEIGSSLSRPSVDGAVSPDGATAVGTTMGTPSYMSPEQIENVVVLDGRADLWSLAVLTFECLTGHLPFVGANLAELMSSILEGPPPRATDVASELPAQLDDWFARALARDRSKRFQTARELSDALSLALSVPVATSAAFADTVPIATEPEAGAAFELTEPAQATPDPGRGPLPRAPRWPWIAGGLAAVAAASGYWISVSARVAPIDEAGPASGTVSPAEAVVPTASPSVVAKTSAAAIAAAPFERGSSPIVQIAAGQAHTCVRLEDGRVACFGRGEEGQLGGSSRERSLRPAAMGDVRDAVDLAAASFSTCVVHADGRVGCAGPFASLLDVSRGPELRDIARVALGPHGDLCVVTRGAKVICRGSIDVETESDQTVAGLSDVLQAVVGAKHVCALRRDGQVLCWGENGDLQLGGKTGGRSKVPRPVPGARDVVQLAVGRDATCARLKDGSVACWGANVAGALGVADTRKRRPGSIPPMQIIDNPDQTKAEPVPGIHDAIDVASGTHATCVIARGGELLCWGANSMAQLGRGKFEHVNIAAGVAPPAPARALLGATQLGFGREHVCAVVAPGGLHCWGRGDEGQLGFEPSERCYEGTPCATSPGRVAL